MHRSRPQHLTPRLAAVGLVLSIASTLGCAGGQPVTPESVEAARTLWKQAGIADYELEWTLSGPNNAHYLVTVQGGTVRKLVLIQPNGDRTERSSFEPRYFGVDGLFLTMADDLVQCTAERPFGQPRDAKVVMRFSPDPKLGYPLWYRRDVMGARQGTKIDVIKLSPVAPSPNSSAP
jgi:hypothetical protein